MNIIRDPDRREVLAASAAVAASRLIPTQAHAETTSDAIRPFKVGVPKAELTELRRRINATRWPERETVTDDSQGVPLAMMQELARYWGKDYDWRKCEAKLNALPQFITEIDGLDIHFIHVRSKHENALPMIVTHGWPGSVIEQLKIIDPLTNPTAQRERIRRFPSGDTVDAGLRLLGQADRDWLEPCPHRTCLGSAGCVDWRIRPSGWQPGLLTTVTVGPSRRRQSPRPCSGAR